MRLLASVHLFPPQHNCGSEWMLHRIFRYMISKGHECRVLLHHHTRYGVMNDYVFEGVECVVGKALARPDTYLWADIILTHLDMTQYTIVMAKDVKRPVVHFVHNDIPYSSIQNSQADTYIVYNSNWIKEAIGYKQPGIVFHPPCDIDYYDTSAVGDPIDREFITLISLNERKGGHKLWEIASAMPDKKFLGVIGSYDNPGPLKMGQMEIVNKLMQLPNVTIRPNTPDILSTYRKTRLLIMPSDYESWGRTATEAMCSGIPVICTPTLGLVENCGNAGEYVGYPLDKYKPGEACVNIGSTEDWVNAIRKFDDENYYREKSLLCKQRSRELDPEKELEQLENFLVNVKRHNIR